MQLSQLEMRISRSENLPILPEAVLRVLRILDDPDCSHRDIDEAISTDAALSGKVLRVANSPFYCATQVDSVRRALSVLGLNAIRSLVVSVGFRQASITPPSAEGFDKGAFWAHSLAVGVGAKILGKLSDPTNCDQLFTAGIMHDVGILALDRFAPFELEESLRLAATEGLPLHDAERRILGFDHAAVGALLCQLWNLPPLMESAVRHQFEPMLDMNFFKATSIIAVADALAWKIGYGHSAARPGNELNDVLVLPLELPLQQFESIGNVVSQEVDRAQESMGIPLKSAA